MAPQRLLDPGGPGACRACVDARARATAFASRLLVYRHAWRGQDNALAHSGQGAQLRDGDYGRAVRRVQGLPGDRRRALRRLRRNGRGIESRRRRDDVVARKGRLRAGGRPLQGLHDRRGAHAHGARVQRDAQDARRAARARQIHSGDDRSSENSGHRALALPAIQSQADAGRAHRVASHDHSRRGRDRERAAGVASARQGGRRQHARRVVAHRSGHCLCRGAPDRDGRARHARCDRSERARAAARRPQGRIAYRPAGRGRRNGRAQLLVCGGIAGSWQLAAQDRPGAIRPPSRVGRLAGSGGRATSGRRIVARGRPTVLPDCHARTR
ncbi:hypothetical protein PEP31012_02528 [Pandoraea eparura]|uniref:Uncharacterized protein n=1 Tax=Pandoraea eparura TaxID=2508291 RepID=A0A5E4VDD4_9BURK|nr:hypothetical protein PEP31012_02528 [Pandoraea eparura]